MKCSSCGYEMNTSMLCRSCGHDNRDDNAEPVIDTPEQIVHATENDLLLRKWLGILFLLIIPSIIGSIMSNVDSSTAMMGSVITGLTSLAYGLILLRLSEVESNYRKAGILSILSVGMAFLGVLGITLNFLLPIAALVISMLAIYYEYCGHSNVLAGVDNVLSESWKKLWKWTIGMYLGAICGALFLIVSPLLGAFVVFFATIGVIIVSVLKLFYLYKTSKSF